MSDRLAERHASPLTSLHAAVGLGLILSLCAPHLSAQAPRTPDQDLQKFTPASYVCPQHTMEGSHADPGGTKLIDGQPEPPSRIIWRTREFKWGPVDVTFHFLRPFSVRRIAVHSWRGPRAYGIKKIQAFAGRGDAQSAIGETAPDQGYHKQDDEPVHDVFNIDVQADDVTDVRVRVKGISLIALTEVEFWGLPSAAGDPPVAAAGSSDPGDASPSGAFKLPAPDPAAATRLVEADLNGDGKQDILIENPYVAYVIEPRWGGVVNHACDKQTKTSLVKVHKQGEFGGVFSDVMWPKSKDTWFWYDAEYEYEVVSRGPEKLAVKLWRTGSGGQLGGVTFEKTLTLAPNDVALRADYRVHNSKDNVVPVNYGLWFHNSFGTPDEDFQLFWPAPGGVASSLRKARGDFWSYEPTRGWIGMVTASGKGCALVQEYQRLRCHYFWQSGNYSTVEWRFGRFPIEAGEFLATTVWLIPFHGLSGAPHGVSPAMVGRIEAEETYAAGAAPSELALQVKPSHKGKFAFAAEQRLLPSEKWVALGEQEKELAPAPARLAMPFKPEGEGTYVVRVTVKEFGQPAMEMERPVVVGKASASYAMIPPAERILPKGEAKKEFKLDFHSQEIVTPHVKWARPYAAGRPNVLFVPQKRAGGREAVELAQRFDLEVHTSYMSRSLGECLYDIGDYYAQLNPSNLMPHLEKMLKEHRFDAIVIPGDLWKHMTAWIKDELVRRVEQHGVGLVLLAPEHLPEKLGALMSLPEDAKRFTGAWTPVEQHFITTGVPFEALPATQALPYETDGKVLATVEGRPLLVVKELGKGRIAAASWVVAGRTRTGYHATYGGVGLLPNLLYVGVGDVEYDYWEHQMSLLARMIYWSARKAPRIEAAVVRVQASEGGAARLEMTLLNRADANVEAVVEVTLRDKFGRVEANQPATTTLKPGENPLDLDLPPVRLGGIHFADVIVRSGGKTEWWGSASFATSAPARIAEIAAARETWQRNERVKCSVRIEGDLNQAGALELDVTLVDSNGRLFERERRAVTGSEERFRLPLVNSRGLRFEIRARLLDGEAVVSERARDLNLYGAPRADRFQVAFGWPSLSVNGTRRFLMKPYHQRLKEIGSTCIRLHIVSGFEWEQARWLNLGTLQSRGGGGVGGKRPYTTDPEKGKYGLIRKPCLSEPGFQEQLVERDSVPGSFEEQGVLYRGKGDELNSIGAWDGCFSEHCRKAFREWLKREYGSLGKLNDTWETSFEAWDQVEAMTRDEVKGRHSLAPWADHRTFNEWNWTRSFGAMRRGMLTGSPGVRLGISGTQETRAFNAYDWWRLAKHVNALASYGGEQTILQRCFASKLVRMPWLGYGVKLKYMRPYAWRCLFEGATGFNVFNGRFNVNPDFTLPQCGRDLQTVFAELGEGRAEAIMHAEYDASPIAFHYSPASVHVDWILDHDETRTAAVTGFRAALTQVGCDYDYLAYEQLENSGLLQKEYRLFVLPMSMAMSDREVEGVRRFVERGGLVVADMLPAALNQHGQWRDKPALDQVFGVRHENTDIVTADAVLEGTGRDSEIACAGLTIPVARFEGGLACAGGQPLAVVKHKGAERPAIVLNRLGRGCTLYLACDLLGTFGSWKEMKFLKTRRPATAAVIELVRELLRTARVPERIVPRIEDGSRLIAVETFIRKNGPIRILGLIRDARAAENVDPKPHTVQVALPSACHVYDLLERKHLGLTDTPACEMGPHTSKALVLSPYEVRAVKVRAARAEYEPGDAVGVWAAVQAETGDFARHTLFVRVLGPDGEERRAYRAVATTESGLCRIDFPLALDDPPGEWTVEATDVLTNTKASAAFTVKSP